MARPRKNAAAAPAPAAAADAPAEPVAPVEAEAAAPAADAPVAQGEQQAGEAPAELSPEAELDQLDAQTEAAVAALAQGDPPPPPADEPPDELLFAVPVPAYIHAIDLTDERRLPADLRQAVEGRLGCLFRMKAGKLTAADGREMTMVVNHDGDMLGLFGQPAAAEVEPAAS